MNRQLAEATLARVRFEDYTFKLTEESGLLFVQVRYLEPDVDGNVDEPEIQEGRRWLIERDADPSALVRTAFAAVMASMEHRAREHFLYRGERVFGPHCDVRDLVELARGSR